mmetsp:Transcript_6030/g.9742  ORF Transcript_6030/g.9742 Transcript_6030/m.9742 type:complete len:132 (+) Transcript_6030:281-676(+)
MVIGRWKCILLANFVVMLGCGLTLIPNSTSVLVGRFIYGLAAGAFSVFCPKYLNEIAPLEMTGPIGSMVQLSVTFGILVPFVIGVFFTDLNDQHQDSVLVYVIFTLPMILGFLQVLLMVTIFNYDTPIFMQ